MRITWLTFILGYLAIIGFPPLSGFFTKDPIIVAAFTKRHRGLDPRRRARCWAPASPRSTCPACCCMTFFGPKRWSRRR